MKAVDPHLPAIVRLRVEGPGGGVSGCKEPLTADSDWNGGRRVSRPRTGLGGDASGATPTLSHAPAADIPEELDWVATACAPGRGKCRR